MNVPASVTGFMVFKDGKPVSMELNDKTITDPYPVFDNEDDAEVAAVCNQGLCGTKATLQIYAVTVIIDDVQNRVKTIEYHPTSGE